MHPHNSSKEHAMNTHPSAEQFSSQQVARRAYGFDNEKAPSTPPSATDTIVASALNELASGVIIIDLQGRVLHCNAAAERLLARGDSVAIVAGTITARFSPDIRPFGETLSKAATGKRCMISLGARHGTSVMVVPLPITGQGQQTLALMFSRASVCESLTLSFFSRAHCLTASEEKVLGLLSGGLTAPEMAEQLSVGESTVRTHVRNICSKTQCNGIREVVNRLAVLPPLMSAAAFTG
jgi:DNA-binding CsgD family transcriptional regulator